MQYVAEYQEHLGTIVVLVHVLSPLPPSASSSTGSSTAGSSKDAAASMEECKAEIIPWSPRCHPKLILRYGSLLSPPLSLPAPVPIGSYPVTIYPGNPSFDVKLPVDRNRAAKGLNSGMGMGSGMNGMGSGMGYGMEMDFGKEKSMPTLLGAEECKKLDPTSWVCTSCSLPVIKCRPVGPAPGSGSGSEANSRPESFYPPLPQSDKHEAQTEKETEFEIETETEAEANNINPFLDPPTPSSSHFSHTSFSPSTHHPPPTSSLPSCDTTRPRTPPSPGPTTYHDLPSTHWSELIDAWMCHPSQTLSGALTRYAEEGIWPKAGQVFLGVSYLLVRGGAGRRGEGGEGDVVEGDLTLEREVSILLVSLSSLSSLSSSFLPYVTFYHSPATFSGYATRRTQRRPS